MSKQDTKKYQEFWNNKEFEVKSNNVDNEENKKPKRKTTTPRKKAENVVKEDVNVVTMAVSTKKVDEQVVIRVRKTETISPIKTLKEMYEQYDIDGKPYKIYLRGNIIFDSQSHKIRPVFYEDYFILFGNKYIYKGIRFEKY